MAKLKTIFLLVLAGFILVGCGDPRADEKAKLTEAVVADLGDREDAADVADCVVNVMSENLDDDAWKLLTFFTKMDSDGNFSEEAFEEMAEFILENDIDEDAMDEAIEAAGAKAEAECEVDLD